MDKERTPGQPAESKAEMARVCYAPDRASGDRILKILRDAGIEAVREGGTRDIYKADSLIGEEILVPAADLEEAGRLLRTGGEETAGESGRAGLVPGVKRGLARQIAAAAAMAAVLMLLAALVGALPGR